MAYNLFYNFPIFIKQTTLDQTIEIKGYDRRANVSRMSSK